MLGSNKSGNSYGKFLKTNSLLILACLVASLWAWQQEPVFAQNNLIFSLNNLEKGKVWTLVAALFVHASVFHLFGNLLFLFVFGNTLEKTVGARKLLMIFFTGGFTSFILGVVYLPRGTGMLGASAAIFALAGASCWSGRSSSPGFSSRRKD